MSSSMMTWLPFTFLFPLLGFVLLAFSRGRLSENISAVIGVGSMALSALTAACVAFEFVAQPVPASVSIYLPLGICVEKRGIRAFLPT